MTSHGTALDDVRTASAVVGMVGGGQLARMTQQAAIGLGVELVVLDPDPDAPAVVAGATHLAGRPDDTDALAELAARCDVVTLDHELVPLAALEALVDAGHAVRPGPAALELAQDKARARQRFSEEGLEVPAFEVVAGGDTAGVERFAQRHGWPVVVKAPTGGYDGRGVHVAHGPADLDGAPRTERWLLEEHVQMATELAVLVARRPSGPLVVYPPVRTTQIDGICVELVMPADIAAEVADAAVRLATEIAERNDVSGILAVEMFCATDGRLLINEVATRPHNSGHATIDAAATSQFENHLRAVLDWPLGDTSLGGRSAAMVNLLGPADPLDLARVPLALADPSVHLHLYGKAWRPGRKLGHITALAESVPAAVASARAAGELLVAQ